MAVTASAQRGLDALRRATQAFINDDPTEITLLTVPEKYKVPGGGFEASEQVARETQTFKLVAAFGDDGNTNVDGASAHTWKYTLIGLWDSVIEVGDVWVDGGTTYRVVSLLQDNGYEKRAAVEAIGGDPNYG